VRVSRAGFNPKRRIGRLDDRQERERLAQSIRYGGNPEHKRNPGDFGLDPPARPRPDKTLCDAVAIFERAKALELLRAGVKRGLVSEQWSGEFPQNIWSVTDSGEPLEAQLENRETGHYHGYPMPENDPFREVVEKAWREAPP
jgi:hypothetical protein